MGKKPPFTVISGPLAAIIEPPATLGPTGAELWRAVLTQYDIIDAGGLAILEDACRERQNATDMAAVIAAEGFMVKTKSGRKEHPLIKHELAARALTARLLQRLGLDLEPVRPSTGRPGGKLVGAVLQVRLEHGHQTDSD
jgi:phage terminase small subunit